MDSVPGSQVESGCEMQRGGANICLKSIYEISWNNIKPIDRLIATLLPKQGASVLRAWHCSALQVLSASCKRATWIVSPPEELFVMCFLGDVLNAMLAMCVVLCLMCVPNNNVLLILEVKVVLSMLVCTNMVKTICQYGFPFLSVKMPITSF